MSRPIRPLKDLYFRFIQGGALDGVLNSQQAASALQAEGLIELIPHLSKPSIEHYRDLQKLVVMTSEEQETAINTALFQWCTDQGLI
jgi:hypothetical protein